MSDFYDAFGSGVGADSGATPHRYSQIRSTVDYQRSGVVRQSPSNLWPNPKHSSTISQAFTGSPEGKVMTNSEGGYQGWAPHHQSGVHAPARRRSLEGAFSSLGRSQQAGYHGYDRHVTNWDEASRIAGSASHIGNHQNGRRESARMANYPIRVHSGNGEPPPPPPPAGRPDPPAATPHRDAPSSSSQPDLRLSDATGASAGRHGAIAHARVPAAFSVAALGAAKQQLHADAAASPQIKSPTQCDTKPSSSVASEIRMPDQTLSSSQPRETAAGLSADRSKAPVKTSPQLSSPQKAVAAPGAMGTPDVPTVTERGILMVVLHGKRHPVRPNAEVSDQLGVTQKPGIAFLLCCIYHTASENNRIHTLDHTRAGVPVLHAYRELQIWSHLQAPPPCRPGSGVREAQNPAPIPWGSRQLECSRQPGGPKWDSGGNRTAAALR